MRRSAVLLATVALCTAITAPASAGDTGWHLRVFAAGFDPDLDVMVPAENPEEVRVTAESDLGFGASLEYQFGDLLGLELGFMQANPIIELSADDIPGFGDISLRDSMSTTAVNLDLNFHLTPDSQYFDFYLGAGLCHLGYGDLHYVEPDGDRLDIENGDDLTYSAKAGLGIALGKDSKWAAIGGLRYIWSDLEATQEGTATFDFNIVSFSVGIVFSF